MSCVRILPEILSNKIAAGEVVERPSSVVKELVENAIDAKSKRIIIEIEKGGRNLIRVSDDGTGMKKDDALLAIERYATSKIEKDSDLFSINTLGFRGEALPSIASVSRFSIVTCKLSSNIGTQIYMEGGQIKNVKDIGAPIGTMIEVKQLFYNIPVRRKFLKTVTTEMGHILDTVSSIALGYPGIYFKLIHNGKVIKRWVDSTDSENRVTDVLGKKAGKELFYFKSLEAIKTDNNLSISGWISSPSINRSTSQKIFIYVNGRYIKNKGVVHALLDGYKGRLMKGRFPVTVLFINIAPDAVDVNVHPTKSEVKFINHKKIHEIIKKITTQTLLKFDRPAFNVSHKIEKDDPIEKNNKDSNLPFPIIINKTGNNITDKKLELLDFPTVKEDYSFIKESCNELIPDEKIYFEKSFEKSDFFKKLYLIGQLHNTYMICQSKVGVILIDQHAAHERIVFEQLKKQRDIKKNKAQKLLIPEIIELSYKETVVLKEMIENLQDIGFEIEQFGGNTFAVQAVPVILSDKEISPIITEIIETMVETKYCNNIENSLDKSLISIACHGAIRAGQTLVKEQMQGLLNQLDQCENPSYCPHGRPTWIQWNLEFLEKSFRRTA